MIYSVYKKTIISFLAALLIGCGDYSTDLGGGYEFVKTNAKNHVVILKLSESYNEIKVHSNVQAFAYNDLYVLGVRVQSEAKEAQYKEALRQGFGYFIINKQTGVVTSGLDKYRFELFVNEYGLSKLADNIN